MIVSYTEDGYLKIKVEDNIKVDYTQLQGMNSIPYFVPSLKDRYEDNVILYHRGEYVSVTEHVHGKAYQFREFKNILLMLLEAFVKLEKDGYLIGNACVSLDNIFIHPQSGEIRVVYVPTEGMLNTTEGCIKELLSELLSGIQTKDSALLLGILLENKNREQIILEEIIREIQQAKEKSTDVPEKIVEKTIEVPVEKIIYKSKNYKAFRGTVVAIEILAGIVIPMLMAAVGNKNSIGVQNIIIVNICGIIITVLAMVFMRDKDIAVENSTSSSSKDNRQEVQQIHQPVVDKTQNRNTTVQKNNYDNVNENNHISESTNRNLNLVQNDISNARVSRNNTTTQKNELAGEGTCVLYGDLDMSQAYFLEIGKSSLMDRIFIDKPEFVFGRESGSDFKVDDNSVSKRHAKVTNRNGVYYIEDLHSSNGTKVNEVLIKNPVELAEGSQVKLGSKVYVFHSM